MTDTQRDLAKFLNEEANAAIARACHTNGTTANALIEEAQELLSLRSRLVERYAPRDNVHQFEFLFQMQAAA